MSDDARPRLRSLPALRFQRDGEEFVAVRDPLGIAAPGDAVVVSARDWALARSLDGSRTLGELEREGDGPALREVAARFSAMLLLEDAAFEDAHARALAEFQALPERPPAGPGRDYSPDPLDVRIQIGGLVADDWDLPTPRGLAAVVAPATDFQRAGRLYSRSYAALRHAGAQFARTLLLATAPTPLERPLVPLARPLGTPLGRVEIDADGIAALDADPGRDELAHRDALSIERQALFLRLLFPRLPVVPVLVGDLAEPDAEALDALRRVLALPGDTLLLVASDLTRAWAQDSDTLALGRIAAREVRERDKAVVDAALALDPEGVFRAARPAVADLPASHPGALGLAVSLLAERGPRAGEEPLRGSILGYLQMQSRTDFVSAASLVYHAEPRLTETEARELLGA